MWFRILVLALGTFAIGTDSFVIAGILPNIAGGLHISLALAGLTVTVFALVYACGAPILATFTGSLERRRLLLASLAILALANILSALATNLPIFMAARVLAAIGASLYTPTATAVVTTLAPEQQRGRALAMVMTGLTASTVLGVPLGVLIGSWLNWQATLMFVALLSVLALVGVLTLFPQVTAPPTVTLGTRIAFLKRPELLLALFQTLLFLSGTQIIATYNRVLLQQVTHLDDLAISLMLLLFGVAGVIGGIVGGYSADRWGNIRTLVGGLLMLVAILFLLPWLASTALGSAFALCVWGIAGWSLLPAQQHRLVAFAPSTAGIILSLNSSAIYLGISSGSGLGSLLIQTSSLSVMCWIAASIEVFALVFILLTSRIGRQAKEQSVIKAA
ncbi:MFS transporter [Ktedonobacter sp. SOSP1-52]|uniref:MFS transporter n=1 Tax=Ktedonobacter sp. SOSP1-52 TaxID=2778366 RepID=UPI00191677C5|nr:MFS transporter [Ktedonobacter sp. SOSP1-52]GHO70538.1 MFS transporter [Ktedonobacter sp. SOSP1-52]